MMPVLCHFNAVLQRWIGCTADSWSGGSLLTAWKQRPTSRPPRQQLAAGACAIEVAAIDLAPLKRYDNP